MARHSAVVSLWLTHDDRRSVVVVDRCTERKLLNAALSRCHLGRFAVYWQVNPVDLRLNLRGSKSTACSVS